MDDAIDRVDVRPSISEKDLKRGRGPGRGQADPTEAGGADDVQETKDVVEGG